MNRTIDNFTPCVLKTCIELLLFPFKTTRNDRFQKEMRITRFIRFDMDIQIEHHLFPNIPDSSLLQIQHLVRRYCNENDIPYIEKSNMFQAIYSYIYYLRTLDVISLFRM